MRTSWYLLLLALCAAPASFCATDWKAIPTAAFQDSAAHWQKKFGRDRQDLRLDESQIVEIADQILRYQNPDGGWPKNVDWCVVVPDKDFRELMGTSLPRSSFDNHTTFPQIEYLARAYQQTQEERCKAGAERGLDFLLAQQRPTGGWRGADVDAITYNDDVMTGIMELLFNIVEEQPQFAWMTPEKRAQVHEALDRAIDVTLKCQIVVNGERTAWCQQHDHITFAAVKARTYELPSITPSESTSIVRFLMRLPQPSQEVKDSIASAVKWFDAVKISGVRLEKVAMEPIRFLNYTASSDTHVVSDPTAPPLWTRYYEIGTNRPFFCNRDGLVVFSLAEVDVERRNGYAWYGQWPAKLLAEEYPAWKRRHE